MEVFDGFDLFNPNDVALKWMSDSLRKKHGDKTIFVSTPMSRDPYYSSLIAVSDSVVLTWQHDTDDTTLEQSGINIETRSR